MVAGEILLQALCGDHLLAGHAAGVVEQHVDAVGEAGDLLRRPGRVGHQRQVGPDHVHRGATGRSPNFLLCGMFRRLMPAVPPTELNQARPGTVAVNKRVEF